MTKCMLHRDGQISQDALVILQHCGLAVHQDRRAMQVALRSGPVKAVTQQRSNHPLGPLDYFLKFVKGYKLV